MLHPGVNTEALSGRDHDTKEWSLVPEDLPRAKASPEPFKKIRYLFSENIRILVQ